MADTITLVSNNPGISKSFALSTQNTLKSSQSAIDYASQYTAQFGRVFNPTNVNISYVPYFTIISVSNTGIPGDGTYGSVSYYDPAALPVNTSQYKFRKALQSIDKMPAWLFALVSPNI